MLTSAHHLDVQDEFSKLIKDADQIASAIDRKDEEYDNEKTNQNGSFQRIRLSSILGEIDFGKPKYSSVFPLSDLSSIGYPKKDFQMKDKKESVEEYNQLFEGFVKALQNDFNFTGVIDQYCYDRMYALLNEYTITIPASTYEGNKTFVSLFDHLKLTSAIASCLYINNDPNPTFNMLEFDISGIQKFIFKVVEGKDTKRDIAKALRGRSLFVSLITDAITYSYLKEFDLTQSNIIFNTGGGALLLLPNCKDFNERIKKISDIITKSLYRLFNTDITYVYSYVTCNEKELELFKIDKAVELKEKLDEEKNRKFSSLFSDELFYTKTKSDCVCRMCGSNLVENEEQLCESCNIIQKLSEFFVKHDQMMIAIDFKERIHMDDIDCVKFSLGNADLYLIDAHSYSSIIGKYDYIESLNQTNLGYTRFIANLVPLKNHRQLNFETICDSLIDDTYGDNKLGVLKMDVDNLGAIFAFGLSKTRSLSKFLTLSRLIEIFFSSHLTQICKDVSKKMCATIEELTDNGTMFYINYAGGDDLVIIGPIAGILQLASEIQHKFFNFTQNENLTISGGIHIQSSKAPIRFGIQYADENLSLSKAAFQKNSMTLLDTTVSFSKYDEVLEKVKHYKTYIDQGQISRTSFYNYMTVLDVDMFDRYYEAVPKLLYSLKRNIKDDSIRIDLVKDFSTIEDMEHLKTIVLEMKLALMQTRG